jgi:hypothetical protein
VAIFVNAAKLRFQFYISGSAFRLYSSNALTWFGRHLIRNSAGLFVTKTSMRHDLLQSLHRRGELPESPSKAVISLLLDPLLFSNLQYPPSLSLFGRSPGRPLSTRTLSVLRFIGVFLDFHDKMMGYYIKADHRQFLPHSFQFICLLFPYLHVYTVCTCVSSRKCSKNKQV